MPSVEGARKKSAKKTRPVDDNTVNTTPRTELPEETEKSSDGSDALTAVQHKTKWQKFKKAVSRKMSTKRKRKGTSVVEVNIVQEDDTDYDKQWSRKITHVGAKWTDTESGHSSSGSSPRKGEDLPEDGILVIHDADDDDDQ